MNAIELFNANGKSTGVWVCGKCHTVATGWWGTEQGELPKNTQRSAEMCCTDPPCETCGKPTNAKDNRSYRDIQCRECRDAEWRAKRDERIAKLLNDAEDVTATYDGPVSVESYTGGDMGEGYYSSVEVLAEEIEDDDESGELSRRELWAFCCKPVHHAFDIERELERVCDDGYEGMYDHLTVPQSLKDAAEEFNRINEKALTAWETDYKRKVMVRVR